MKLLIVEDEEILARYIVKALRLKGHVVEWCADGELALVKILEGGYNTVILDVVLPGLDGLSVCQAVRSAGLETPIIILSSKDEWNDRVLGLEKGADDYLIKPFHIEELTARITAMQRRVGKRPKAALSCGRLSINLEARTVLIDNEEIVLRPKEFDVLAYLVHNKGRIVSREELLSELWSGVKIKTSSNRVDVCIRNIRNKIDVPYGMYLIKTRHKSGYEIDI